MDRWPSEELDEPGLPTVLKSLDDDKCRTILTLLAEPKSASELCEECGLEFDGVSEARPAP